MKIINIINILLVVCLFALFLQSRLNGVFAYNENEGNIINKRVLKITGSKLKGVDIGAPEFDVEQRMMSKAFEESTAEELGEAFHDILYSGGEEEEEEIGAVGEELPLSIKAVDIEKQIINVTEAKLIKLKVPKEGQKIAYEFYFPKWPNAPKKMRLALVSFPVKAISSIKNFKDKSEIKKAIEKDSALKNFTPEEIMAFGKEFGLIKGAFKNANMPLNSFIKLYRSDYKKGWLFSGFGKWIETMSIPLRATDAGLVENLEIKFIPNGKNNEIPGWYAEGMRTIGQRSVQAFIPREKAVTTFDLEEEIY